MQQLLDSVLLPDRVNVGNLVFGQGGKVEMDLEHFRGDWKSMTLSRLNEVHSSISPEQIITVVISPLLCIFSTLLQVGIVTARDAFWDRSLAGVTPPFMASSNTFVTR